ncbi:MAG: hypothetical protein NT069_06110 [Planctomycetota bacterium]|nr:hypothetical protein [Planctomycetota bacterium]
MASSEKINPTFRARLTAMAQSSSVRALLMLHVPGTDTAERPRRRRTQEERILTSQKTKELVDKSVIDALLLRHAARQISDSLSALGTLVVEAPAASLLEFESESVVRAVLDDQSLVIPESPSKRKRLRGDQ